MNNYIEQENDGNNPNIEFHREDDGTIDILSQASTDNEGISSLYCDCPLSHDLRDISGRDNHLSSQAAPIFVPDPENASGRVLSLVPSEDGTVIAIELTSLDYQANIMELDFYIPKDGMEDLSIISGPYAPLIIPDNVIPAETWVRLRVENLQDKSVIQLIQINTGTILKREEERIFLPRAANNRLVIGYCGWKGKALKGYLRNFRIFTTDSLVFHAPLTENLTDIINNVPAITTAMPPVDINRGVRLKGAGKNTSVLRFDMSGTPYVERLRHAKNWTIELFLNIIEYPPSDNYASICSFGYQYIMNSKNALDVIYLTRDSTKSLHIPQGIEKKMKATYDGSAIRIYSDNEFIHEEVTDRFNPSLSFTEENKYINNISLCSQAWIYNDRVEAWIRDLRIYAK